ncbi:MAG: hypothetical protein Q8Q06_02630 [bacterium]|nr:hypothetical protein [bacterium]
MKQYGFATAICGTMAALILLVFCVWFDRSPRTFGTIVIGMAVIQFVVRRHTLAEAGFRPPGGFKKCFVENGEQAFAGIFGGILYLGMISLLFGNSFRHIEFGFNLVYKLIFYIGFASFQQYILSSYFVNMLADFFGDAKNKNIPIATGIIFAIFHAPNWFLMLVCLPAGYLSAENFLKYRNLPFLILAHFLIGMAINFVFPDSITNGMRVGPNYFGPIN